MQFKFEKPNQKTKSGVGCLYGCSALLLLIMIFLTAGYFYFRDRLGGVTEIENISDQLDEKYGKVEDFFPPADGSISPERLEIFLRMRDSLKVYETQASDALQKISQKVNVNGQEEEKGITEIFSMITSGLDLMPDIITYIKAKYKLLDKFEMSKGEYFYIYTLAYYNYLGHKPGDGPDFRLVTDEHVKDDDVSTGVDIIIRREKENRDKINKNFRKILKNQVIQASKEDNQEYIKLVRDEIDRLLHDPFSLPWEDNLPVSIQGSFTRFHDRLEKHYNYDLNPIEIMLVD